MTKSTDRVIRFYASRPRPKGFKKEPKTIGVAGTIFLVILANVLDHIKTPNFGDRLPLLRPSVLGFGNTIEETGSLRL